MCGLRYVGFSRCAVSDMWDSADVRWQICGFKQMCGVRYVGFSRCAVADMWVFNGCALEFGDSTDVLNNLLFRYAKFHTDVCQRQVGDLLLSA